jgi:uncharacterized protein YigA (DUF484 family)
MSKVTDEKNSSQFVTQKKIKEYLLKNPNFFDDNPDTLENLVIPHFSGGAISLVERQVLLLREKNLELSEHIKNIRTTAEDNVKLFKKTSRLVSSLIMATDFESLISRLSESLSRDFQVEFHQLILFDDYKIEANAHTKIVSIEEAEDDVGILLTKEEPLSGISSRIELEFLFGNKKRKVKSAAAARLFNNSPLGILAIGNSNPNYYNSILDTIFFRHVTKVLNGLIPKIFPRL